MHPPDRSPSQSHRPARSILAFLLIGSGAVLLLNNLGIVPWSIWPRLAQLWPVILILLGLELVLGRSSRAIAILITILVLVIVAAAVVGANLASSVPAPAPASSPSSESVSVPLENLERAEIRVTFPVGTLNVDALPTRDRTLLEATAATPSGARLVANASRQGGVTSITLAPAGDQARWWPFAGSNGSQPATWKLRLAPAVPLALQLSVGAGQTSLDLSRLLVQELTISCGAGQTTIYLPAGAGQTNADIRVGAGQVVLVIPPGVGASIHRVGALVDVQVPRDRFQEVDDGFQTADYPSAPNRVDLTLRLGIGSVDVR